MRSQAFVKINRHFSLYKYYVLKAIYCTLRVKTSRLGEAKFT